MTSTSFNRRQWLKSGALAAAGLTFGKSAWNPAEAATTRKKVLSDLPVIKARLSANENPFGPSEKARKAIIDAIPESFLYPRQYLMEFRKMVAQQEGVSEDHVMLGAGSGELLVATALCYTFKGGAGGHVVSGDPSYMQLIRAATQIGLGWE